MSFHEKEYEVYILLSDPSSPLPWTIEIWKDIHAILEPFTSSPRGKAAIRTTQIKVTDRKKISFGKLSWDEKSYSKWTHTLSKTNTKSADWQFISAEAWAPSWITCQKENSAPDFFLSINNEQLNGIGNDLKFGSTILVALAVSDETDQLTKFKMSITHIAMHLNSPLVVWKHRKWGLPTGNFGFTNALNDLGTSGLFKAGPCHQRSLDTSTFAEQWLCFENINPPNAT